MIDASARALCGVAESTRPDFKPNKTEPVMSHAFRHRDILEIARKEGKVTVDGLAQRFGVTLQTIRRDLSDLAEDGRLERVHGGAMLPSSTSNIGYEQRRTLNARAKAAMARDCAARIPNNISL